MAIHTDLTGARLDAAVEMAIFGRAAKVFPGGAFYAGGDRDRAPVPRYSEDMNATMHVVREMRKQGFGFTFSAASKDLWFCSFAQPLATPSSSARSEIATWAICWAALRAIDNR